jgi:hypothetical protein
LREPFFWRENISKEGAEQKEGDDGGGVTVLTVAVVVV